MLMCMNVCVCACAFSFVGFIHFICTIRQRADCGQLHLFRTDTWVYVCVCACALNASCADKCCCNSIAPHKGYNPHRHYHIYTAQENRLLPCVRLCLCTCVYHKLPVFVYKCTNTGVLRSDSENGKHISDSFSHFTFFFWHRHTSLSIYLSHCIRPPFVCPFLGSSLTLSSFFPSPLTHV